MVDCFTKRQRSRVMSLIRSERNRSTELRMIAIFRRHGIKGWRRRVPLPGKPDFVFPKERVCLFVDGCFWHGCPQCYTAPKTNATYWREKIAGNKRRDASVSRLLRRRSWAVLRIRECKLGQEDVAARRSKKALKGAEVLTGARKRTKRE